MMDTIKIYKDKLKSACLPGTPAKRTSCRASFQPVPFCSRLSHEDQADPLQITHVFTGWTEPCNGSFQGNVKTLNYFTSTSHR